MYTWTNSSRVTFLINLSEKCLMQKSDVPFQVFLYFFIDPSLKVNKVKSVGIVNFFLLQPLHKERKMFQNFLSAKDSIDHVTTEQSHLDLVSQMWIYFLVFVNCLENIRGSWSIGEFELIEGFLSNLELVTFLKVFNWNVL